MIKHQYYCAARVIQKVFRGFISRKHGWSYGGILFVGAVVKIQRVFRGYLGRKKFLAQYKRFINIKSDTIKSLFYKWKFRQRIRIREAKTINKLVVKLQSLYRGREDRKMFRKMRESMRNSCALRIQRVLRGFFGRKRSKYVKRMLDACWDSMTSLYQKDIKLSRVIPIIRLEHLNFSNNVLEIFHLSLVYLLLIDRPLLAIDLLQSLKFSDIEDFHLIFAVLNTIYFSFWKHFGKIGENRQDLLEEAVFWSIKRGHDCDPDVPLHILQLIDNSPFIWLKEPIDQSLHLGGLQNRVEIFYFQNIIRHLKLNFRVILLVVSWKYATFPVAFWRKLLGCADDGIEKHHGNWVKKISSLCRLITLNAPKTSMLYQRMKVHQQIGENIFGKAHSIVFQCERKIFHDFRIMDYLRWTIAKSLLTTAASDSIVKDFIKSCGFSYQEIIKFFDVMITLAVEVELMLVHCGEFYLFCGKIRSISLDQLERMTQRTFNIKMANKIVKFWDMISPKLHFKLFALPLMSSTSTLSSILASANVSLYTQNIPSTESLSRPLVLIPEDISHLYEVSVAYFMKLLHLSYAEVVNRGKSRLLGEYLVEHIRLVTSGSRSYSSLENARHSMLSNSYFISPLTHPSIVEAGISSSFSSVMSNILEDDIEVTAVMDDDYDDEEFEANVIMNARNDGDLRSLLYESCRKYGYCSLRLSLPSMEYVRTQSNTKKITFYSVAMIQRIYRGFIGRSRYRRLLFRKKELVRQIKKSDQQFDALIFVKRQRSAKAARIQAIFRGFSLRKKVQLWHLEALIIQCWGRRFLAQLKLKSLKRQKIWGPDVIKVLSRSISFVVLNSSVTLTLLVTVYRCGHNYKFQGYNYLYNQNYEGFVYQDQLQKILDKHNDIIRNRVLRRLSQANASWRDDNGSSLGSYYSDVIVNKDLVKLHHYDQIAELLISKLSLTPIRRPVVPNPNKNVAKDVTRHQNYALVVVESNDNQGFDEVLDNGLIDRIVRHHTMADSDSQTMSSKGLSRKSSPLRSSNSTIASTDRHLFKDPHHIFSKEDTPIIPNPFHRKTVHNLREGVEESDIIRGIQDHHSLPQHHTPSHYCGAMEQSRLLRDHKMAAERYYKYLKHKQAMKSKQAHGLHS